ncbi:hypothetical protein D7Y13_39890 [Corallococcus praedator]|uniref:Uncharacterized protein n=1 Tax=Corallococcus praedator TaxID=2316724 RepID=A0ABX9Q5F8_9BACT|nr:hypothetical protein D7Y13_39890 [Corallococcus praedator]
MPLPLARVECPSPFNVVKPFQARHGDPFRVPTVPRLQRLRLHFEPVAEPLRWTLPACFRTRFASRRVDRPGRILEPRERVQRDTD